MKILLAFLCIVVMVACIAYVNSKTSNVFTEEIEFNVFGIFKFKMRNKEKRSDGSGKPSKRKSKKTN